MSSLQYVLAPHLAVVSGPDQGCSLGPGLIGRNRLLSDPNLSRSAGYLELNEDRLLLHVQERIRKLRPGQSFRLGQNRFQVRKAVTSLELLPPKNPQARGMGMGERSGPDRDPGPRFDGGKILARVSPLLSMFFLLLLIPRLGGMLFPTVPTTSLEAKNHLPGGPLPGQSSSTKNLMFWFLVMIIVGVLINLLFYVRGRIRRTYLPADSLLAALYLTPTQGGSGALSGPESHFRRGDTNSNPGLASQSWSTSLWLKDSRFPIKPKPRDFRNSPILDVHSGSIIALLGPQALGTARWLAAQLIAQGQVTTVEELGSGQVEERSRLETSASTASECTRRVRIIQAEDSGVVAEAYRLPEKSSINLLVVSSHLQVPAGCSQVVKTPPQPPASETWWQQFTSALGTPIAESQMGRSGTFLSAQPRLSSSREIYRIWEQGEAGTLRVPVGTSLSSGRSEKLVYLDLADQGPHALLGGTSGAGKSEALLTWVLSMACRYSPRQLSLVLIDYKGGATFQKLEKLPHVQGVLSDLDEAQSERALNALLLELKRRESLFQSMRVSSFGDLRSRYPTERLPRIVIVVDEFRELAQKFPEHLEILNRLAAQGRSLGLHLILATQRPAGAITAEIKANSQLRVALRVTDKADSFDLLDSDRASRLPKQPGVFLTSEDSDEPGRFWLTTDSELRLLMEKIQAASGYEPAARALWTPGLPTYLEAPTAGAPMSSDSLPFALVDYSPVQDAQRVYLSPEQVVFLGSHNPTWIQERIGQATEIFASQGYSFAELDGENFSGQIPTRAVVHLRNVEALLRNPELNFGLDSKLRQYLEALKAGGNMVIASGVPEALVTKLAPLFEQVFIQAGLDPLTIAKLGLGKVPKAEREQAWMLDGQVALVAAFWKHEVRILDP
ncbi:hypothetical protein BSR28_08560 [Boudabousia liubingyangii]|nr:hypothetical protein BSR28_08560 [Boudabousia liubingyangii]